MEEGPRDARAPAARFNVPRAAARLLAPGAVTGLVLTLGVRRPAADPC